MSWKTLLAYITGTVDQELLMRNEYLVTENRILRSQIKGRLRLSDGERKALAEMGQKLGKQALKEVAKIVQPDTILGWHRKLVAQKFDGSQQRKAPGRHTLDEYVEHYHHERNHQRKGNVLLLPTVNQDVERAGPLQCRKRLGGLLQY